MKQGGLTRHQKAGPLGPVFKGFAGAGLTGFSRDRVSADQIRTFTFYSYRS